MTDDLRVMCKNENFPDLPETCFSSSLTLNNILGIISILNKSPSVEFKDIFKDRWSEIKEITLTQLALNKMSRR